MSIKKYKIYIYIYTNMKIHKFIEMHAENIYLKI